MSSSTVDAPQQSALNGSLELASYAANASTLHAPPRPQHSTATSMTLVTATAPGSALSRTSPPSPFGALTATTKGMPDRSDERSRSNSIQTANGSASLVTATWADGVSPVASQPSMSEAFGFQKAPNLIRRLSRGAQSRLRRRTSSNFSSRIRDQSAGPVLVRRRSDSTGQTSDLAGDMSDLDIEPPCAGGVEDNNVSIVSTELSNPLGISTPRKSQSSAFEGGIAPTISPLLEQGTWLVKVTKKKRKTLKFRIDALAAKVCWDPTNPSKQFYIDDVRDIRVGADARNFREDIQVPADQEGCWITIVYDVPERSKGRTIKTMHLIAPNDFFLKLWTNALNAVSRERIDVMNALSANIEKSERSMQIAWKQAMARKRYDEEQKFEFDDARWLCRKLEINCSPDAVRAHFNTADHDLVGRLTYGQYEQFVKLFKIRQDVRAIYHAIKPCTELELSFESFCSFLRESQSINVDKDHGLWEGKFDSFSRSTATHDVTTLNGSGVQPCSMNLQAFQNFLISGSNSCLAGANPDAALSRPLNEYFVSSSHNTYLLGRQVAGASSVEGYISALVKGCRCIEVDCWDGKDGRPIVNHGRTMSSQVLFEDCISVIAKYAFASSSYPLIISLEVHCNAEQQAVMVDIMKKYFAATLLTIPLMSNSTTLPSPEELRNRILLKVKSTHHLNDGRSSDDFTNGQRPRSHSTPFVRGPQSDAPSIAACQPEIHTTNPPGIKSSSTWSSSNPGGSNTPLTGVSSSSASDSDTTYISTVSKTKKRTSNIIPVLGALSVYTAGVKYTDFNSREARMYNHILSFSETTLDRICKDTDTKRQLEKHNTRYLMRVYPSPRRLDSSNFNPLQSWRRGAQMAALNWQTYDVHTQVNEAMFAAGTDRTGYVLKPEELRHAKHLPITDTLNNGHMKSEKKGHKLVKFSVEIISAQRLPRPRNHNPDLGMNPYVEFEMYSAEDKARGIARGEGGTDASARDGSYGIGSPLRKRTKIAEGNGFDPVFNQPISMAVETKYPGLIFVRWTVWNSPDGRNLSSNNTILATFTAKLSSLQQGYRHLPLFNAYGERYRDAKLFVKIKKEAPLPLHIDKSAYGNNEPSRTSQGEVARNERSWTRKIFSRTPSERRRGDPSFYNGSFSRTSSMER